MADEAAGAPGAALPIHAAGA